MKWPTHQQISLVSPTFRPRCIFVLCSLIYAILRSKKWFSCSDKCFEILGRCNLRFNRQQGIYAIMAEHCHRFIEREFSICIINYEDNNTFLPPTKKTPARNVFTQDVVDYIESEKLCKPRIYTSEIQQRLLLDGVVPAHHSPSQSGIKKCVRDDCHMTKKKRTQVATESLSEANVHYTDYFLDRISQLGCCTLHFFYESGVIITSGNRLYGNSYLGEPTIELQKYASNANYTLNLLHSMHGNDYYNILRGPSNGMEMLNFFLTRR